MTHDEEKPQGIVAWFFNMVEVCHVAIYGDPYLGKVFNVLVSSTFSATKMERRGEGSVEHRLIPPHSSED